MMCRRYVYRVRVLSLFLFLGVACGSHALLVPALVVGGASEGTTRGLLVGIDYYDQNLNKLEKLTGASQDAIQMARALAEVTGAPIENFIVLTTEGNNPVTKGRIVAALEELRRKSTADDTVIIMFSAHGKPIGGHPYLLPSTAELGSDLQVQETCFAVSRINAIASEIKNRALIVCYDMCRAEPVISVAQAEDIRDRSPIDGEPAAGILLPARSDRDVRPLGGDASTEPRGQMTIFACGPNQLSREWGIKKRGFFSYFFEEALREAADEDGVLKLGYVVDYVKTKVAEQVAKLAGGAQQTPHPAPDPEQIRDLVLARGRPPGNAGKFAATAPAGSAEAYDAFFRMGMEFFDKKDYASAERMFNEAFDSSGKTSGVAAFWTGRALAFQERHSKAHPWFLESVKLDPKLGMPHNNIGLAYEAAGLYEQAIASFEKCIELEPRWPMAYLNLGNYYKDVKRDFTRAETLYRKAIEVDQTYAPAHNNLAWLYIDMASSLEANVLDKAREHFLLTRELDPTADLSYLGLAYLHDLQGKYSDVEMELLSGLDACQSGALYLRLARFYEENDEDLDDARIDDFYRRAAQVEPAPSILQPVAWHFMTIGEYEEALEHANRGLAIDESAALYNTLGAIHRGTKTYAEAVKYFLKARELDPGEKVYTKNLAKVYRYDLEDMEKAEREYRSLLESAPRTAADYIELGEFYSSLEGRDADVLVVYKRGFDEGISDWEFLHAYGAALARNRQWEQLRKVYYLYAKARPERSLYMDVSYSLPESVEIECLRQGIAASPRERTHYEGLRYLLDDEEFKKVCDLAERNNPKDSWPHLVRAELLLELEQYAEAEKAALRALAQGDTWSKEALDLLWDVYLGQFPGEDEQSSQALASKILSAYDLAVKRWPDDWELHDWRGFMLLNLKRADEAYGAFLKAMSLISEDDLLIGSGVFVQAALLALDREDVKAVDEITRQYEGLGGVRNELWLDMAEELESGGDLASALIWAKKALEFDPKYERGYSSVLFICALYGDLPEIETQIARAEENGLKTLNWRANLANDMDWSDNEQKRISISLFEKEISAFPDNNKAHLLYGLKLEGTNDLESARRHYEDARLAEETTIEAAATLCLARVFALQGQHDRAEPLFRKAARSSKTSIIPQIVYVSFLLDVRQDTDKAEPILQQVLQMSERETSSSDLWEVADSIRPEIKRWRAALTQDKLAKIADAMDRLDRWTSDYAWGDEPQPAKDALWRMPELMVTEIRPR